MKSRRFPIGQEGVTELDRYWSNDVPCQAEIEEYDTESIRPDVDMGRVNRMFKNVSKIQGHITSGNQAKAINNISHMFWSIHRIPQGEIREINSLMRSIGLLYKKITKLSVVNGPGGISMSSLTLFDANYQSHQLGAIPRGRQLNYTPIGTNNARVNPLVHIENEENQQSLQNDEVIPSYLENGNGQIHEDEVVMNQRNENAQSVEDLLFQGDNNDQAQANVNMKDRMNGDGTRGGDVVQS